MLKNHNAHATSSSNPPPKVDLQGASQRPIEQLTYSVEESATALGVSKPTIYRLIARGLLRPIPELRHKRIPCSQVRRFAAGETGHTH